MTRASMLLSLLVAALLGQPAFEPVAAAASAPPRPAIEISLADTLRALPVSTASANGGALADDGGTADDPPLLPPGSDNFAASPAEATYSFLHDPAPAERRPNANRARAPPTE